MVHLLVYFILLSPAQAQDEGIADAEIFRSQVDEINERYENFFSRQEEQRLYSENIKQGIGDLKEQRRTEVIEKAEALRAFKLEPREKPDTTALEAEFEAEKLAHAQRHEQHRKAHVNRRDQVHRISQSARKIPENQDAGLE